MWKCLVSLSVSFFCNQNASCQYEFKDSLVEEMAGVIKDNKFGFVDAHDRLVIPIVYESADRFQDGLAKVKKNNMIGFINKRNEVVVPFTFSAASSFFNGSAMVYNNKLFWLIDKQGNQITPRKYDLLNFYDNDYCMVVMLDKKYGCINDMAHGPDGWAVVVSKDANYLSQKMQTYDHFDEAELQRLKSDGYVLSDLAHVNGKYYAVFTKLAGVTAFYYQTYTNKPNPSAEELLGRGYNIYRILDVAK